MYVWPRTQKIGLWILYCKIFYQGFVVNWQSLSLSRGFSSHSINSNSTINMSNKKQIFKISTLQKFLSDENSCVSLVQTLRLLALPSVFLMDMKSGILYLLNKMLKKYDRSLGGIVIGYQNIKVLLDENTGIIPIGTSETEVNISVEFYIFQPRIGSLLQGIVNKKSNNHVGCLVHRYFNATILKPEDVDYSKWICQNLNIDDKIIFKVKDLDFTGLIPLIEGIIDDGRLLDKVKSNLYENCDISNDFMDNVDKMCPNKVSFVEDLSKDDASTDNALKKNGEIKSNEINELNYNVNQTSHEFDRLNGLGNNKKKNKTKRTKGGEDKEVLSSYKNHNKREKREILHDKESISDPLNEDLNVGEMENVKKKDADVKNTQASSNVTETLLKKGTSKCSTVLYKIEPVGNKSKIDLESDSKVKKVKKSKKNGLEEPCVDKTNQCSFSNEADDEIFYSTQLHPYIPKRIKICCSPIRKSTPFKERTQERDIMSQTNMDSEEKKSKHRKRKSEKEKDPDGPSGTKKIKASISSFEIENTKDEVNYNEDKSVVQTEVEDFCRKQLDRTKRRFSKSDKGSSKERKMKKRQVMKEKKETLDLNEKTNCDFSGVSRSGRNPEVHSLLDELQKQEIQRVKEELKITNRESGREIQKREDELRDTLRENASRSFFNLSARASLNGRDADEKKFSVTDMMDQLSKREMNLAEEECKKSEANGLKKENKGKKNQRKTHNALFEKLLKDAKSAMDLQEGRSPSFQIAKKSNTKQMKDLADLEICCDMKGLEGKADQDSQNRKDFCETPVKYKNGSMYDAFVTPEKVNLEKSLFSDSEQSNSGPNKREKLMDESETKVFVQNSFKKEIEKVKNKSGNKKERKSNNSEPEQESLYEKLLNEAKNLIQDRNLCPLRKKKEKHLVDKKKQKKTTAKRLDTKSKTKSKNV